MGEGARRTATWCALSAFGICWALVVAVLLQTSYDTAMGVALFHLVGGVGAVVTWSVARRTEDVTVVRIIVLGWAAKMVGTLARYLVLEVLYGGSGDAHRYSSVGAEVAAMLRDGRLQWHRPGVRVIGTPFVEYATGVLFAVTGRTTLGGFVVSAALGFAGTYLLFRAVRIAAPEVDPRRYALLLFLLPSMAFWPSSLGKEAFMVLAIGAFTYGVARIVTRRGGGVVAVAAGCALSALIRPHITLMLVAALLLATVVARSSRAPQEVPVGKFFKVLLAAALVVWAASVAGSFLEVDPFDTSAVGTALESTGEQTDTGGSAFTNVNPVYFPLALVTVLYRPFPFEAGNVQGVIASAEGMFLLVLTLRWRHALWSTVRSIRDSPMLSVALVYVALFVYAYTGFNNFGLLARQRSQVYPFLLMLLAVVPAGRGRRDRLVTTRERAERIGTESVDRSCSSEVLA